MLPVWGAYIWRGLCKERLTFGILWYVSKGCQNGHVVQWPMSPLQLNSLSHGTKTLPGEREMQWDKKNKVIT